MNLGQLSTEGQRVWDRALQRAEEAGREVAAQQRIAFLFGVLAFGVALVLVVWIVKWAWKNGPGN
jgi:hypothetical protein